MQYPRLNLSILPRLMIASACAAMALVLVLAAAQEHAAQTKAPTPNAEQRAERENDLIHLGDIIDIDVVGNLEFDWRGPLTPEGFLSGPDTIEEPIYALCRTESDVAAAVTKAFSKVLRSPEVLVRIIDRSGRAETLLTGAVRTPTKFQIRRPVTLTELLVLAGGITDRSDGDIDIFRPRSIGCKGRDTLASSGEFGIINARSEDVSNTTIKVSDLLSGRPGANPNIVSGDIVTVREALPIYVIGGVNNPRQLSSKRGVTLSHAIASCGGLAKEAVSSDVTIFRRSGRQTAAIHADLELINDKKAEDIVLEAFDIVDVAQKGRPKRSAPPRINSSGNEPDGASIRVRIVD